MNSECKCFYRSCERSSIPNKRFQFVKEDGVITDRIYINGKEFKSGLTPNDIDHCELKCRVKYKDNTGVHDNRKKVDIVEVPMVDICPSRKQATFMAKTAGIELSPQQIDDYVFLRDCPDIQNNSDQQVLDTCLDPIQTRQFRDTFHI